MIFQNLKITKNRPHRYFQPYRHLVLCTELSDFDRMDHKCDIQNIDLRNLKYFIFLAYKHVALEVWISKKVISEILNTTFGYAFGISEMLFGYVMMPRLM